MSQPDDVPAVPPLVENGCSRPFEASAAMCRRFQAALATIPELKLGALVGRPGWYTLTAGSVAGVIEVAGVVIDVRPKLPVARLLFLLGYALNRRAWHDEPGWFEQEPSLVDAMAAALARQARAALARGRLHDYIHCEDALRTVRGRIDLGGQIARRFGRGPLLEVAFQEFTDDVLEHRLIKAAVDAVLRWPLRQVATRRLLRHVENQLSTISPLYVHHGRVPEVHYTRLNEHYRSTVELSRLVLKLTGFDARRGAIRASGLLVDMNRLFEDFVTISLHEALAPHGIVLHGQDTRHTLDERERIRLKPDLLLEARGRPVLVGDAKYKRLDVAGLKNADVYQALAYAVALKLPAAALIYPSVESRDDHIVRHAGVHVLVRTLDLSQDGPVLLAEVQTLAAELAQYARVGRAAA
jgi:5-methylcytosine-specific restriction enzyme subunit McrC